MLFPERRFHVATMSCALAFPSFVLHVCSPARAMKEGGESLSPYRSCEPHAVKRLLPL